MMMIKPVCGFNGSIDISDDASLSPLTFFDYTATYDTIAITGNCGGVFQIIIKPRTTKRFKTKFCQLRVVVREISAQCRVAGVKKEKLQTSFFLIEIFSYQRKFDEVL